MSLKTWKKEFYKEPFVKKPKEGALRATKRALNHSIKKWEGTLDEDASKHNVAFDKHMFIADKKGNELEFDASSCALCGLFVNKSCNGCPLHEINDCCGDEGSSYLQIYENQKHPSVMVNSLKRARRLLRKGKICNP